MTEQQTTTSAHEEAERTAAKLQLNDPRFREEHEFETYRLLQEELPAAYLPNEMGGHWLFTRYEDCRYLMQHWELFSSNVMRDVGIQWIPQTTDPPEQREYRRLLEPMMTPALMSELEPDIAAFANGLIDKMIEARRFDFIEAFAGPFPTSIFCRLMGFPLEDLPMLLHWENILLHGSSTVVMEAEGIPLRPDGLPDAEASLALRQRTSNDVVAYLQRMFDARRAKPENDMMSQMLAARYEGTRPLSDDELVRIGYLYFLAGLDTVTLTLGMTMHTFAQDADARRRFIETLDDRHKLDDAVEEVFRYHTVVNVPRITTQGCPVAGADLPEGSRLLAGFVAANRDPRQFDRPDELVFDRHPNPHLAFAVGIHRCIGIHLARREVRIALKAIHERMPAYRIEPGKEVRLFTDGLRGVHYLPLEIC